MCKLNSGWGSCGCYSYCPRRVVPAIPALIGHLRKSSKKKMIHVLRLKKKDERKDMEEREGQI